MTKLNKKKLSIHFWWWVLLINIYLFSMYTPIITYPNTFLLYNKKIKLYSDGTTLFYFCSIQIQIFRQFFELFILFCSKKTIKNIGYEKRLNYSLILTRIFCCLILIKKINSFNIWNSIKLSNFFKIFQLMIGLEFGLYLLYLFEISFFLSTFKLFFSFIFFLYTISFLFEIQKLTYRIPILLLIPENYFNLKCKKFLKKKIFFTLTIKFTFFIFYFFKLNIIKIIHEKNTTTNLLQRYRISNILFTLGIIAILIKHFLIFYIWFAK